MEQKFFRCKHCGNFVAMIEDYGVPLVCCGDEMELLTVNTEDASHEKHVPEVKVNDDCIEVNVGSVDHPMIPEHHITFIYLKTKKGGQRKNLEVDAAPFASFCLCDDEPVAAYAYCNLHGLWKVDI